MFLLFLLVIPSFILVGIDSSYFSESSPVVARVDGKDITQAEWDNAHRAETDRIHAQSPSIDSKLLDTPQMRYATLERMVRDRVLANAVQKMHIVASDSRLASALKEIPAIAALRRADGTLDTEGYRQLLAAQGLTPEGFEANMRRDLSVNQVLGGVFQSSFGTDIQLQQIMDALYQRREIQVANFTPAEFVAKVLPTEEAFKDFYQKNTAQFLQPEQADIEYLVLDLEAVRHTLTLNEEDVRTYYKENLERLAGKEERRASHILFNVSKEAPAAEREKAKTQAQELLGQLQKTPSLFAELAKKNSQDSSSAKNGGDLGFFARGAMTPPFENMVFSMKKGQISELVETDFGYHIILLSDIKTPPVPSFEAVRPKLEAELKEKQAQNKFAEVAEIFSNGVYEQADSLQPIAEKLKLKIQKAQHVMRQPIPGTQGALPILENKKFLESLFSTESIENKRNTEAVEIAKNTLVSGRITEYTSARTLPYEQVQARVREMYVAEKSADLAREQGQAQLKAWKEAPAQATRLRPAVVVSREQMQNLPRPLVEAALSAAPEPLPAWTGVDLGAQGYAVIKVARVLPREPIADTTQASQQLQQWLGAAEGLAYYEALKHRFKVEMKVSRPE